MRRLIVLRHAKSAWSGASDFDRPLNERGLRDAPRIGQWLADNGYTPTGVICSPAKRAKQTALAAGKAWSLQEDDIKWDSNVYEASLAALLHCLAAAPAGSTILLVGHNPGLEQLVTYLAPSTPHQANGKLLATGTAVVLQLPDDWTTLPAATGKFEAMQRGKDLP